MSEQKDTRPLRLVVLISGSGSNLQALIDAIENKQLTNVEIALVISNKADAYGLLRALKHKVPAIYVPWKQRAAAEARIAALIQLFQADLIVLAGFMRILSADFFSQATQPMLNLHPSLLPSDGTATIYTTSNGTVIPALRGLHVVQRAIDEHLPVTGCTVHYVIPAVDAGPVICRAEVPIFTDDTEEILQERIKQFEHKLVVEAVQKHQELAILS